MIKYLIQLYLLVSICNAEVTCDSDQPALFKFLSKKATQIQVDQSVNLSLRCFKNITVQLKEDDKKFYMNLTFHQKIKWNCTEMITLSTGKTHSLQILFLQGKKTIEFKKKTMSLYEVNYIRKHGIKIFKSCDDLTNLPKNLSILFKLFFGGLTEHKIPIIGPKVSKFMERTAQQTLMDFTDRSMIKRDKKINFKINKNDIKSGDVVLLWRMDGFNTIIQVGSGSRAGHSTIALWKDDQLYICESKSSTYMPINGVKCTHFDQWVQYCKDSDVNLILLPLKDQYRQNFNLEKAWDFVNSKYNNDYGFHNFFFGWIDTPNQNLPEVLDLDYLSIILSLAEKFLPQVPKKFFLDAFNKRLGTENLNMDQIWEEIYKQDTTIQELSSIPEQESWQYDGQTNYTCSSFVTAVLKNAGVFGDLEINSTEFTPKDLYELEFWQLNKQIEGCEQYMEDGYCQFLGHYKFQLGKTSFVKPYNNMDEKCPTLAPDYDRTDSCQLYYQQ